MKTILLTVALTLMFMPSISDAAKPIKKLVGVPVSVKMDGTLHSLQEVGVAIIEACLARGWVPDHMSDGVIRATIDVRAKHFAEIEKREHFSAD